MTQDTSVPRETLPALRERRAGQERQHLAFLLACDPAPGLNGAIAASRARLEAAMIAAFPAPVTPSQLAPVAAPLFAYDDEGHPV